MSHKKGFFGGLFRPNIISIILASIGVGMLAVIVLPFWVWVICVACACIYSAIIHFFK